MQTDQLGQRAWLGLKLWWVKQRFLAQRLVQLAGFAVLLLGAYAFLQRAWPRLAAMWTIPDSLYAHWMVAEPMGNIVLMTIGAVVVWVSTGRH